MQTAYSSTVMRYDEINDPVTRNATISFVNSFGQIQKQVDCVMMLGVLGKASTYVYSGRIIEIISPIHALIHTNCNTLP